MIQARLAVLRCGNAVLGATSVAQWKHLARQALGRQSLFLVLTKLHLSGAEYQFVKTGLHNVAQTIVRINIVITGVKIAIVL